MSWLADQGADTVADLRELPPGTYTCKELAESLGLPVVKAQRLLTALEGARSAASRRIAPLESQPFCMTGASQMHSPPPQPQPAAQVGPHSCSTMFCAWIPPDPMSLLGVPHVSTQTPRSDRTYRTQVFPHQSPRPMGRLPRTMARANGGRYCGGQCRCMRCPL
jgi:hypothetical protein